MFATIKTSFAYARNAARQGIRTLLSKIPFPRLTKEQWLYLPRLLSPREKIAVSSLSLLAIISLIVFVSGLYLKVTVVKPGFGGTYREGLIAEPRFINPLYAATNDTDRDITALVFPGLIRYTPAGDVAPNLAESVNISDDGKTYTARLRNNLSWQDGVPLTADDVVFTIKTIQNPEFKSPYRQNWQGVLVERVDGQTVRFTLGQPYAPFIENLSVGIMPEHLWEKIPPEAAALSDLNLKPVGAGPYQFKTFTRLADGSITSYTLSAFPNYWEGRPHIAEITFRFYPDETAMIAAYYKNEIDGISAISPKNIDGLKKTDITIYSLQIPQVVGLFFNENKQEIFTDKNVRRALAEAIDTPAIIRDTLLGAATIAPSPIPPASRSFNSDVVPPEFNVADAKLLLANAGWKDTNGDGVLGKKMKQGGKTVTVPLHITLATSDYPSLVAVAGRVKDMWSAIGVATDIQTFNAANLGALVIRPRAYEVLLFGEIFGHDPDPFAFWHTSQIKDPGLNIALYSNRNVDALLEDARRTADADTRDAKYRKFQTLVTADLPAIFLFSPTTSYGVRSSVKGINIGRIALPHERFMHIEDWYINTRRGLK